MKNKVKILCAAVALALSGHISAATSWTLSAGTVAGVGDDSAVTVTSKGWSNTGAGATVDAQVLESQTLSPYSGGLGITNRDSASDAGETNQPEHALDNNGRYEMVRLYFGTSAVKLTNAMFGWTGKSDYSSHSEYSVMAYTGVAGGQGLLGKTWASLAAVGSGWTTIGNYEDAVTNTNNTINDSGVFSSYWLIGAYNPLAAGSTSGRDSGNDYLKLKSVTGCVSGSPGCTLPPSGNVPEPGSLPLVGLALLGMLTLRKRLKI